MSAKAFRDFMSTIPDMKHWITGQTKNTSSFLFQTRKSSKEEIRNSIVDHIVPVAQLKELVGSNLATAIVNELNSNPNIYQTPLSHTELLNIKDKKGNVVQQAILFKNIKFENLNKIVARELEEIAVHVNRNVGDGVLSSIIESNISENNLDKGHVFGWANTLVQRTKQDLKNEFESKNLDPETLQKGLDAVDAFIDSLLDTLEEYDMLSSNIQGLDAEVFAKYKKTDSSWLIEWQINTGNQKSGGAVATLLGKSKDRGVRGFIKEVAYGNTSLIEKTLKSMVEGFVEESLSSNKSQNIFNLESSPSMKDMFVDTIISALSGSRKKLSPTYIGRINIANPNLRSVSGKDTVKSSINKTKSDLINLKAKVKKTKQIALTAKRVGKGKKETSLVSLQSLINQQLNSKIRSNMGIGDRKDILNYRSGRFASSVKVERLTKSKEGMISAFYSYMKYPYATFSEGGRQQYPRTRDPKLLISKSIREIAAERVSNRLRAVAL